MSKKVLLVCHMSTFFTELLRVAQVLKGTEFEPVLLFKIYPTASRDIILAQSNDIRCLDHKGNSLARIHSELVNNQITKRKEGLQTTDAFNLKSTFKYIANNILFRDLFRALKELRKLKSLYSDLLKSEKFSLIVLAGDQVGYDTPVIINSGHKVNIKSVVVPSTMSNGLEQAEVYFNDPSRSMYSFYNRLVGFLSPKWVKHHKGKALIRENGGRALAMDLLGISPPLPWVFQSGYSDAIFVESMAMRDYYLAAGLPAAQLVLTGSLVNDIFFEKISNKEKLRDELYKDLGFVDNRPFVLCNLPADFLYVPGGRPQCDFQIYQEMVDYWIDALVGLTDYNVVLSLHPSVKYEDMKYIERASVKISKSNVVNLIPLCHFYVASISSTIRWAIACSKPVLNYDVYRYQYTDYLDVPGVVTIEEKEEFLETLNRLAKDSAFYAELTERQSAIASYWGELDGGVGDRMLNNFRSLV